MPNPFPDSPDMTKRKAIYTIKTFIGGEPVKRSYVMSEALNATLKEALGDYITARDIYNRTSIRYTTLRSWRNSGKIRAMKFGSTWFYSRHDLVELIKTSK
jgi:hypothetical protein